MRTHGPELAYVAPGLPLKFSRGRGGAVETGAMALLAGESAGMALDFTGNAGLGFAAVKGHTTNLTNVPVDQFLTQSGTSPKLVMGADGLYHWSPHNLILQSQTFDNAAWTKSNCTISANAAAAPDGTLTADRLDEAAAGICYAYQTMATVTSAEYTATICFKRTASIRWGMIQLNTGGGVGGAAASVVYFDIAGAGAVGSIQVLAGPSFVTAGAIQSLGDGWYRASVIFAHGSSVDMFAGPCDADGSRNTSGGGSIYVWGAQLNRGSVPTTYHATTAAAWFGVPIEYGGGGYYALVEPQATNILLQSQAFDNASWGKSTGGGVTITANQTAAPDGTTTADRAVPDAVSGFHVVRQGPASTAAVHTHSVFVKPAGYTKLGLREDFAVGQHATFLLTGSGSVIEQTGTSATITALAGGWYFLTFTPSSASASMGLGIYVLDASYVSGSPNATPYTGDGTSGVYLWGAQMELGAVATSPIPTFAATVTRAQDKLDIVTASFPYSSAAGSWYVEFTTYNATLYQYLVSTIAGNMGHLFVVSSGSAVGYYDGTTQLNTANGVSINVKQKALSAYSGSTGSVGLNAGTVATGLYDGAFGGAANLGLGYDRSMSAPGLIGRLHTAYFLPRRVTDGDIVVRTTL